MPDFQADLHDEFRASSSTGDARRSYLLSLSEKRKNNDGTYWSIAHTEPQVTTDDLELLFPVSSLPKVTDGQITYLTEDWLNGGQRGERRHATFSATLGQQLKDLIHHLSESDPEFLSRYVEGVSKWRAMDHVMSLHALGGLNDLKSQILKQITHIDDFVLGFDEFKRKFEGNEYYPYDYNFRTMREEIASAYIKEKLPAAKSDEQVADVLRFAKNFPVDSKTLEFINTTIKVPNQTIRLHIDCVDFLKADMLKDPGFSLWLLGQRSRFPEMSDTEKLELGQRYIDYLAKSYGFYPPPKFELNGDVKSDGAQTVWDGENREECFAHPLGRIQMHPDKVTDNFQDFLETLSHEFTHGVEDASMFLLNTDFQAWHEEHPEVKTGHDKMQSSLHAVGLVVSFNTNAYKNPVLEGAQEHAYTQGRYYNVDRSELEINEGASEEEVKREEKRHEDGKLRAAALYLDQVRERHAGMMQTYIAQAVQDSLGMTDRFKDPINIVMTCQLAMFPVRAFIKENVLAKAPAEKQEEYAASFKKMETYYKDAEARGTSYWDRARFMALAFMESRSILKNAFAQKIISPENKEAYDLYLQADRVADQARHGFYIIKYREEQGSAEIAPPAVTPAVT